MTNNLSIEKPKALLNATELCSYLGVGVLTAYKLHYLTDWNTYSQNGYEDKLEQKIFNLAVDALKEMACKSDMRIPT